MNNLVYMLHEENISHLQKDIDKDVRLSLLSLVLMRVLVPSEKVGNLG